jgi:hypothetical protein
MEKYCLSKYFYWGGFIFLGGLTSCISPDPLTDLIPEEKDTYVTNRDKSIDFSEFKTYYIVDSVQLVTKSADSTDETIESAPLILNTVNSELQKSGFVKVNSPELADVGVSVSVLEFSEDVPVGYYPYLGGAGYYGYISPAFYGYPGYGYGIPPYYGYYQIEVGSISIELFDLKSVRITAQTKLNVIWSALLAGSLAGESQDESSGERIVKAITSAFQQSPYLNDGK